MGEAIIIPGGIICMSSIDFKCPYCEKPHADEDDKLCDRINRNKSFCTSMKCDGCERRFGVTADITGDLVSFPIGKHR